MTNPTPIKSKSKCCEKCYDSFGGGSTMLPLIRRCINIDCDCHSPKEPKGSPTSISDYFEKPKALSPKEPKKPSERIYEIRTTYPFSETHPRDFNKSLLEYLDESYQPNKDKNE